MYVIYTTTQLQIETFKYLLIVIAENAAAN